MLFLITKKQKDKILDEYYSYLINIFSLSLFILFVIFIVSLFPAYLLMTVDKKILNDKIEPLQVEIDKYKSDSKVNEAVKINDNISILSATTTESTLDVYREIKSIYKEIPNAQIISINVDTVSKKVIVSAMLNNKNTASILVDRLNSSKYKGADLPYSIFGQSKSFIFNQNLNYE